MNYFLISELMTTEQPGIWHGIMHSHDNYEIYLFLEGKSDYLVEGSKYRLRKGDLVLMRRGELHINSIRANITYKRCYVNFEITSLLAETGNLSLLDMFDKRPLGKYNHYRAKDFPGNRWLYYMQSICNSATKEEKLCYLLPLLNELGKCFSSLQQMDFPQEPNITTEICNYINSDLTKDLSLERLSEKFYISKTHLNRLFKANVGTTVAQYIKLKRLYLAKELMEQGLLPTEVYLRCGFRDYTTFYRAFRQQFGQSPAKLI